MNFKWMEDKNKVKDLFDHVRNFFICGALLYVAILSLRTAASYTGGRFLGILVGLTLFAVFIIMISANFLQGIRLMFPRQKQVKSGLKRLVIAVVMGFYLLCAMQVVDSVYAVKFLRQQNQAQEE